MDILKRYVPFGLALVFAVLASASVYQFLKDQSGGVSHANPIATMPIVVAKQPIGIGEKITEADLTLVTWPRENLPEDSFKATRPLLGRTASREISENEPLLESKLLGSGEGFSSLIPADMRAVTVSVRDSEGLAQILERGSLVDVLALVQHQDTGIMTAETIVEKAHVIGVYRDPANTSVNSRRSSDEETKMEVSLIVTPKEAKWIIAAMNQLGVDLMVRRD